MENMKENNLCSPLKTIPNIRQIKLDISIRINLQHTKNNNVTFQLSICNRNTLKSIEIEGFNLITRNTMDKKVLPIHETVEPIDHRSDFFVAS